MIPSHGVVPQVALIGVKGYAAVYVEWLLEAQANRLLDLVAVCALPHELKLPVVAKFRNAGAMVFDSYEKLFADENLAIDLCFIPTGIPWHARMTIAALRTGCNVLVEKPLAGSLQDAREIQEAEAETGNWVAVGFQDMYTEEVWWLKESLVSGAIGDVKSISVLGIWPRNTAHYKRNKWAGRLHAEGASVLDSPLNNAFSHFVNLALFLAGPTIEASSDSEITARNLYRAHDIESFDTAVVTAKSPSGVSFWFGVSHSSDQTQEPTIRIEGSEGHATWNYEQTCSLVQNGKTTIRDVPRYEAKRDQMFRTVLKKLKDPVAMGCNSAVAISHTSFIEALHDGAEMVTVTPPQLEMHSIEATYEVPNILGIADKLREAFTTRSLVPNLEYHPANV